MFDLPYTYYDESLRRRIFKPGKSIRHQQTCPVCGRELVNTYEHNGTWKCRRCWEKAAS